MKPRILVIAGLILLVLLVAAGWVASRAGPDEDAAAPAGAASAPVSAPADADPDTLVATAAAAAPATRSTPAAVPARADAAVPLPPARTPLRDSFAELDRAARGGDAHAACRLAAELTGCRDARRTAALLPDAAAMAREWSGQALAQDEIDRRADSLLQHQSRVEARIAHCDGVDLQRAPPGVFYFALAADAGHVPSMIEYLDARHYDPVTLFRHPDLLAHFRANAMRYFTGALEAGDLALLAAWRRELWRPGSLLVEVLPPRWREPGVAEALQQQLGPQLRGAPDWNAHGMAPVVPSLEQREEATRLREQHYADARWNAHPHDDDDFAGQYRCASAAD